MRTGPTKAEHNVKVFMAEIKHVGVPFIDLLNRVIKKNLFLTLFPSLFSLFTCGDLARFLFGSSHVQVGNFYITKNAKSKSNPNYLLL